MSGKARASGSPEKHRLTGLMLLCLAIAGAVVARSAQIQLGRDPRLETMARKQFQSKVLVRPRRGVIADRNGEPLAVNAEAQSLAMNPSKVKNPKQMAHLLSKALDLPENKLRERLAEKREFAWLKRHMNAVDVARLKHWRLMDAAGDLIDGLWLVRESRRVYPHGELAAHILGDVNLDTEGLEGIELQANDRLQGKVISVSAIKDALGRPAFLDAVAARDVKDGESIQLTIDGPLQFSVEQELKHSVARTGARSGSVIVMNAENGEILAMANEPSFNPNDKAVPPARRRNRAITDGFEPGSTMKALLVAGALTNGWHLTDRVFGEHGSFLVQGHRISEAEAHERFEWISLKKLIQVSSNVGAAKVALRLGADKYSEALRLFGIGSKTKVDFPGEISGKVPARKEWQPIALANLGFGQGMLVTPIQVARAFSVFANGGSLVTPTMVVGDAVEPPRKILSPKVVEGVNEALRAVMEDGGTGVKARVEGFKIAGKTGTAQVVDPATGKYSKTRYVASFVGFPVGIEPKIVIFTAIDDPKGGYYAADTAAPLFKAVLEAAARRLSLPSSIPLALPKAEPAPLARQYSSPILSDRLQASLAKVIPASASAPVPAQTAPQPQLADSTLEWAGKTSDGRLTWRVPSLAGLTSREALRVLRGHRFAVEMKGTGVVRAQVPAAGTAIPEGAALRISLGEP